MAALGSRLLGKTQIAYLATVRREGAPRVHPVCPFVAEGRLFVSVGPHSPKRHDLRRDGRYALHALPGKDDAEFYLTGRATELTAQRTIATARKAAQAEGLNVNLEELTFELDIEHAMTAYWEKAGQPGTYAVRKFWHAGQ
jgi:hypothetical protein